MTNTINKKGFYGGKFFPFHRGHLHCVIEASSYVEELYVVMFYNSWEELAAFKTQMPFGNQYLTPKIREMVIRKELASFPNIKVITIDCAALEPIEGLDYWEREAVEVTNTIGEIDCVFSSEPSYTEYFDRLYPEAKHIIVDAERSVVSISGTELRNMTPAKAYEYLPRAYQEFVNKKVLIVGTESCGKSTLTKKLAKHFNTSYTEEYGRTICLEYDMGSPDISVYNTILFGQQMAEREASLTANKVVFCDTDAIVTQYYAELYENTTLPIADAIAANTHYDLVIYLEPTNRWVDDGLRQHGEQEIRNKNDIVLKQMFIDRGYDIKILNGTYYENYINSIKLVNSILYEI